MSVTINVISHCKYNYLYFQYNSDRLKVKGQRKIYNSNTNQKKARVAILIPDKGGLRIEKIIKNRGEYCIFLRVHLYKKKQWSLTCMHLTTEHQNVCNKR
jgi:hypothetical protein